MQQTEFESFVNSERCKTAGCFYRVGKRLRALLIQKDVKHRFCCERDTRGLRALLIQKDVKLTITHQVTSSV